MEKLSAGISRISSKCTARFNVPFRWTNPYQHNKNFRGIWDVTQVYLDQKPTFEVLLHRPSQSQGKIFFIKNSQSAGNRTRDRCKRGNNSTFKIILLIILVFAEIIADCIIAIKLENMPFAWLSGNVVAIR